MILVNIEFIFNFERWEKATFTRNDESRCRAHCRPTVRGRGSADVCAQFIQWVWQCWALYSGGSHCLPHLWLKYRKWRFWIHCNFFFDTESQLWPFKDMFFFFMNNHLIFECGCGEPWIIAMGKLTVKNVYFNVINSIISFLLTIQGYISFKEGLAEQCVASKERVCEGKWSEYAPKILILSQGIHWILIMSWRSPAGRGKTRGVRNLVYHFGLPWFSFYFNYKRRSSLTQLSTTSFIKNLF